MRLPNHMIVADTPTLHETLSKAIQSFRPKSVLETGTHLGTGTTQVILHALDGIDPAPRFVSLEADRACFERASARLAGRVLCLHGMSVYIADAVEMTLRDPWLRNPPEDCAQDASDPAAYLGEIHAADEVIQQGLLHKLLPMEHPLICLDSAGSVGLLEFLTVCNLQPAPFLLFLDDVNHVKHWRSRQRIMDDIGHWKIWGFDMNDGWMIAERLVS